MLFNSFDFAVYLPIVFAIYWVLRQKNHRVVLLLIASYVFYGWWDWRFLGLIAASSVVDYSVGLLLSKTHARRTRSWLLLTSLVFNLGLLCTFKYLNFFIDNFVEVFSLFGTRFDRTHLDLILPVGISFYTFQTLSYTIDIYRMKVEPEKNILVFFTFVSFFPQLVAGPIERASHLIPQFKVKHTFEYQNAISGLRQILWGLFKKMVIADNCAIISDQIFNSYEVYPGYVLIFGAIFFAMQIYGDFSGYSDIAIGVSKLFGFDLMRNFSYPYFSRDIAEFWRRWHISLTTWFRDYIYIPLGGSKVGKARQVVNTFVIFLVSGFWHGANWTFIFWGLFHALMFIPLIAGERNRKNIDIVGEISRLPRLVDAIKIIRTFILVSLLWIFFRADTLSDATNYMIGIFDMKDAIVDLELVKQIILASGLIFAQTSIEWIGRHQHCPLDEISPNRSIRWLIYSLLIFAVGMFSVTNEVPFIYFQF